MYSSYYDMDELIYRTKAIMAAKQIATLADNFNMRDTLKRKDIETKMPKIIDYSYDEKTGTTYIKWSDKTETTVTAEDPNNADRFTGFMTAYAKKAAGNTSYINNLYDKWAIKKPIKDKIEREKKEKQEAEQKRVEAKRRAKFEKYLIRKEAVKIKREYEARKLAKEKYGVPFDEE